MKLSPNNGNPSNGLQLTWLIPLKSFVQIEEGPPVAIPWAFLAEGIVISWSQQHTDFVKILKFQSSLIWDLIQVLETAPCTMNMKVLILKMTISRYQVMLVQTLQKYNLSSKIILLPDKLIFFSCDLISSKPSLKPKPTYHQWDCQELNCWGPSQ